jgi:hypothetical protein
MIYSKMIEVAYVVEVWAVLKTMERKTNCKSNVNNVNGLFFMVFGSFSSNYTICLKIYINESLRYLIETFR